MGSQDLPGSRNFCTEEKKKRRKKKKKKKMRKRKKKRNFVIDGREDLM